MDELSSLERQIPPETINSLRTHFTRRHWHPFGRELLEMVYASPNVQFGQILKSIIGALSIDLDPFIISELLGILCSFIFVFNSFCDYFAFKLLRDLLIFRFSD